MQQSDWQLAAQHDYELSCKKARFQQQEIQHVADLHPKGIRLCQNVSTQGCPRTGLNTYQIRCPKFMGSDLLVNISGGQHGDGTSAALPAGTRLEATLASCHETCKSLSQAAEAAAWMEARQSTGSRETSHAGAWALLSAQGLLSGIWLRTDRPSSSN